MKQLMRFGVVGVTAMAVHLLAVYAFVTGLDLNPLAANIMAFLIAFQVSYFGHARYTFNVADPKSHQHKIKFFAVAVFSLLLNEASYSILLNVFHMQYFIALTLVLFGVAVCTFVLSRLWAFRE